MPLDRTELLARGLVRAQEMSGHEVPIVSLLDNAHLTSLTPEEKIEIIKRYSELTGHEVDYKGTPMWKEIARGAGFGATLALPVGLMAQKMTMPPLSVLRKAKTAKAWKAIYGKAGKPLQGVLAMGATIGGIGGYLQGRAKQDTNRYLKQLSTQIATSPSEEEKRINSAAMLASTPYLARGVASTAAIADNYVSQHVPGRIEGLDIQQGAHSARLNNYAVGKIPKSLWKKYGVPSNTPPETLASNIEIPYNNWDFVPGIGWTVNK